MQYNPTVPGLSNVRWWSRTWTWPLSHRPAGQLLTASSFWNTRLNMCWKITAKYEQVCVKTNSGDYCMSVIVSSYDFLIEWSVSLYRLDVLHLLVYQRGSASWGLIPETPWSYLLGASGLHGSQIITLFEPITAFCSVCVNTCSVAFHHIFLAV